MEVAIIVIIVFVTLLVSVVVTVRLCNKYNCVACCEPDSAESLDDLDAVLNEDDEASDSLEDDEPMEDRAIRDLDRNFEVTQDDLADLEREDLVENDVFDEDHVTLEIDGEEAMLRNCMPCNATDTGIIANHLEKRILTRLGDKYITALSSTIASSHSDTNPKQAPI
ncbi:hypothetical protein CAPTEDRAFT_211880 [Capitella teleta]|uniref:Uncharacterized protein n=1 Tax=Capitella teleta TaxID=283909 RepID=R7TZI1_CAPTE|nr:hypothetical protein CAPTEDRAFT_211880 [Capitella teleta]|eukprot:ELT99353.1 hypothetical protein CAPTEDRAFT_211880 [Capitella teleta]